MTTFVRLSLLSCIIGLFIPAALVAPGFGADNENLTVSLNRIREIYVRVRPIYNPIVIDDVID